MARFFVCLFVFLLQDEEHEVLLTASDSVLGGAVEGASGPTGRRVAADGVAVRDIAEWGETSIPSQLLFPSTHTEKHCSLSAFHFETEAPPRVTHGC